MLNFTEYLDLFKTILDGKITEAPYDDTHFIEYVKLNQSRQNRWIKTGIIHPETLSTIQSITNKQEWLLIAEPWCGDASHIVPFIVKMAELNPFIELKIQLRDGNDSEINNYLTNGGKSIPILVVRNENGEDLFHWGPRPASCHELFLKEKAMNDTLEHLKIVLQQWYNEDKGVEIQNEICAKLNEVSN